MIYSFFIVRKLVAHIVTFVFYCVVLPATVLVPDVEVPRWGAVYIPTIITILNAVGTPRFGFLQAQFSSPLGCISPWFSKSQLKVQFAFKTAIGGKFSKWANGLVEFSTIHFEDCCWSPPEPCS